MKSEQWKWVDIAKGIGIILVFLGHFNIPDTLRAEIYTFHIPLFFFLSGVVFNGHKPINRFLGDEAKRMIVPYYCWAFFYFVFVQAARADRTRTKCQYWQRCIYISDHGKKRYDMVFERLIVRAGDGIYIFAMGQK